MSYEHDGCIRCAYEERTGTIKPCCDCKGTKIPFSSEYVEAKDYWVPCDGFEAVDVVNHPSHYTQGGIECIDAMVETQGKEAVMSFCICNAFKYLWRHRNKEDETSIDKAFWYLKKYIELRELNERTDSSE